jgi:2-polyprenyl-6-hydroxyphenyl methylase/3-demethylubiquinone-9 3-methyltransferase
MAEYVLGIVPKGTHDWNKFINPLDLINKCEKAGMELIHLQGAEYELLRNEMKYSKNTEINYLVSFRNKKEPKK